MGWVSLWRLFVCLSLSYCPIYGFAFLPFFFFSSRRRHTRYWRDWSSDVCSSDLVPGAGDSFVYGQAEAAVVFGETNILRTPDQALTGQKTKVLSFGGAAVLGVVHRAKASNIKPGSRPEKIGRASCREKSGGRATV